ncbi:MAG: FecR domain-containing protein [Chlamydiae bacterium]|nr:FecR domain-containing protein [Chlamydiota bacterium]MBI3267071.1 FecR domain-containing protein [Chlamydiota bacterium]
MKKIILASLFLLMVLSLLQASPIPQPLIQSLQGEVQILKTQGSEPAKTGMALSTSDILSTGPHSFCVIKMDEENSLRVKQNSKIKIKKIWEEVQKSDGRVVQEYRVNVTQGELTAQLGKLPKDSEFKVSSPVAVAGAKGTVYTTRVEGESGKTRVSVLDHEVLVESLDSPNKTVTVQKFRWVDTAPWDETTLNATGRALLSEAILGKNFAKQAEQNAQIQAIGTGPSPEEAKFKATYNLSRIALQLHVEPEKTVGAYISQSTEQTQKFYQAIAKAQVTEPTQKEDGSLEAKAQINVKDLAEALKHPLSGITQSIIPVTLSEYSSKFGALARVTTQRAAQVEGYRNLAEIIYGVVIDSNTTVQDLAVKNDTVRTVVQGVVKGAKVVNTQYFSDGSVIVSLEIQGGLIPQQLGTTTGNVFGQNYLSSPRIVQYDEIVDYLNL